MSSSNIARAGARRGIGTIEDRMQCGCVPAWDAAGVLYSISVLVKEIWESLKNDSFLRKKINILRRKLLFA